MGALTGKAAVSAPHHARGQSHATPILNPSLEGKGLGREPQISAAGSSAISFRNGAAWSMRPVIVR